MNDAVRGDSVCHSAAGTAQTTAEFLTRFQTFPERYHLRSAPIALCERDTADAAALQEVFLVFLSGSRNTCHSVSAFSAHGYGVKKSKKSVVCCSKESCLPRTVLCRVACSTGGVFGFFAFGAEWWFEASSLG